MATDPLILQAELKYRQALVGGDANARRALFKAYSGSFKSITSDLNALTAKIATARAAGEEISASWLMLQQRYRSLQSQTATMVQSMATALGTSLPADQAAAAKAAELMVGTEAGPIFHKLPAAAVEGVIGTTTTGSPLRTLLDSFNVGATDDAARFLRSRLIAGITLGRAPQVMAKELAAGVENLTLSRALTISRTETQRALRRATALSIQANGDLVAGWVWRSAADERTCPACFSLHGTFFPGATPMRAHPNCRCIMIPKRAVKGDDLGFGNAVKVGNGADLFKALPAESQLRILGPGRYELYKSGKVTLNQMRTLRANPIWGPSYQVKALRDLKNELDHPPPPPKPKAPKPTPQPTGALPSPSLPDEVSVAEATAQTAPKAVSVAPKAIQKAEAQIAAQESRLLDIAEAERQFDRTIPNLEPAQLRAWIDGELEADRHIIRITIDENDWQALDYATRQQLQIDTYYPRTVGERDVFYRSLQKTFRPGDGSPATIEFTLFRTVRKLPYQSNATLLDPLYRAKVIRALPEQTADMKLILQRAAAEKKLSDLRINLARLQNPEQYATRAIRLPEPPPEVTPEQLQAAQQRIYEVSANRRDFASVDELLASGEGMGNVSNAEVVNYMAKFAERYDTPVPSYGYFVRGDVLFTRGSGEIGGYQRYQAFRIRAGMTADLKRLVEQAGQYGSFDPFSPTNIRYLDLPASFTEARLGLVRAQQAMTEWREYEYLKKISAKPKAEVPINPAGESFPIPASSSFTGKPRKWTAREDFNLAEAAKDRVSYRISQRLAKDDDFIRSMAENDRLGEWITQAGRTARPAVKDAAEKWAGWTRAEREQFLRTGSAEKGYYQWNNTYGADGALRVSRGGWQVSSTTDGQAFIYDYTSQMVQQWAVTSGDSHILSVALQRAAMEEFGLADSTTLAHFMGRQHSGGFGVDAGPLLEASEAFFAANGTSIRHFLRHMYEQTQEELAIAGIDTIRMVRGVGSVPRAAAAEWREQGLANVYSGGAREGTVDLQPMSSFAVDASTARRFGGTLIYVDVPASWIVGTCRTGFGCLNEYEWVVLGKKMRAMIKF